MNEIVRRIKEARAGFVAPVYNPPEPVDGVTKDLVLFHPDPPRNLYLGQEEFYQLMSSQGGKCLVSYDGQRARIMNMDIFIVDAENHLNVAR